MWLGREVLGQTDDTLATFCRVISLLATHTTDMMKLVFGLCCLFGNSLAAAVTKLAVVEHLAEPPVGWTRLESANTSQIIRLSIALESHGHEVLERTIHEVSDPNHPRYGQHLSRDAALTLIRPQQDAVDAVRRWLSTEDIIESQIQPRGLFVDVTVTIGTAERVLSTKYDVFQNTGRKAIGTLAYSVPADVRPHITSIQPTTFFEHATFAQKYPTTRRSVLVNSKGNGTHTATPRKMDDCKNNNTPSCLRNLYRMDDNSYTKPHPKSLLGVVGFGGVSYLAQIVRRLLILRSKQRNLTSWRSTWANMHRMLKEPTSQLNS